MVSMTDKINDRMQSEIDVVQATGSTNSSVVFIWVKNIGTARIDAVDQSDIFLGPEGNFARINYYLNPDKTPAALPYWSYNIENGTEWGTGSTIKITVTFSSNLSAGTYYVKVVIPNGIQAEYYFSI